MKLYTPCNLKINERIIYYVPSSIVIEKTDPHEKSVYKIKFKITHNAESIKCLIEWMQYFHNEIVLNYVEKNIETKEDTDVNIVFKKCFFASATNINDHREGHSIAVLFETNNLEAQQ